MCKVLLTKIHLKIHIQIICDSVTNHLYKLLLPVTINVLEGMRPSGSSSKLTKESIIHKKKKYEINLILMFYQHEKGN